MEQAAVLPDADQQFDQTAERQSIRVQFALQVFATVARYMAVTFVSLVALCIGLDIKFHLSSLLPGPLLLPTVHTLSIYVILAVLAKCMPIDLTAEYRMLKAFVGFSIITIVLYLTSCFIYTNYPVLSLSLRLGLSIAAPHLLVSLLILAEMQRLWGGRAEETPLAQYQEVAIDQIVLITILYLLTMLSYLAVFQLSDQLGLRSY